MSSSSSSADSKQTKQFKAHKYLGRIVYRPPNEPQQYDDPQRKRLELTRAQLEKMFPQMIDLPISVEHHGAKCGKVVRPYFDEDGSACILFELDTDTILGQQAFTYMASGMIGLSLSHDATTLQPVEVSICMQGARDNTGVLEVIPEQPQQTTDAGYIDSQPAPSAQPAPLLVQASTKSQTFVCNSFVSEPTSVPETKKEEPERTDVVSASTATKDTTMMSAPQQPQQGMQMQMESAPQFQMPPQQQQQQQFMQPSYQQQQPPQQQQQQQPQQQQQNQQQQQQQQQPQQQQQQKEQQQQQQQQGMDEDEDAPEESVWTRAVKNPRIRPEDKQAMITEVTALTESQNLLRQANEQLLAEKERLQKEIAQSQSVMQTAVTAMIQSLGGVLNPEQARKISSDMLSHMDVDSRNVLVQASQNAVNMKRELDQMKNDFSNQELLQQARNLEATRRMKQYVTSGAAQGVTTIDTGSSSSSAAASSRPVIKSRQISAGFGPQSSSSSSAAAATSMPNPYNYGYSNVMAPTGYTQPMFDTSYSPAAAVAPQWQPQQQQSAPQRLQPPSSSAASLISASSARNPQQPQQPNLDDIVDQMVSDIQNSQLPDHHQIRSLYKNKAVNPNGFSRY